MLAACASVPRLRPLSGVPAPKVLPRTAIPSGHRRLVFDWEYREKIFHAKGQGVARVAAPDSVRLDFFLENGTAGGYVLLLGDSTFFPADADASRYIPSVPLLWASLGRLTPTGTDTVVAVDGDSLRADIGRGPAWRATFVGNRLVQVQRITDSRIEEYVIRSDTSRVVYHHARAGRTLRMAITKQLEDTAFDEAIWRR
ncbi:MAG: hypothetical protein U0132_11755 [Gemmatimonadaceae bacterium]